MKKAEHNRRPGRSSKWARRTLRMSIYARDGFACVWCGLCTLPDVDGAGLTLDHAEVRLRGGNNAPDNLLTACARCNCSRQHKTIGEFARWLAGDDRVEARRIVARVRRARRKTVNREVGLWLDRATRGK